MAGTWGHGLKAFAGGLSSGFAMGLEKSKIDALKKEQKRLEEAQEEAKRIFQQWYDSPSTKEFCANMDTASQGERAYFISGLMRINKDIFGYFTEIDNDIREGNIEAAKSKNDLLETKIKSATDLAKLGMTAVFPDGSPMKISPEDLQFQKQIQIGKMAGGPTGEAMGGQMWKKREFGELPEVAPELTDTQVKLAEIDKLAFLTEERRNKMKVQLLVKDSTWAEKVRDARAAGATDEDIVKMAGGGVIGPEPTPEPTPPTAPSIEKVRIDILNADTFEDAQRIYNNQVRKYGKEGLMINLPKDWIDAKQGDLMDLTSVLNKITAGTPEGRNVKGKKEFTFEINGKAETKTGEEWYKDIYESYIALLDLLKEMGVDISKYKRLKPLSEIKKIKFGGFVGSGVETGDLTFIYY